MIAFYTLLGLVFLRLIFIGFLILLLLSTGPACPACGGRTIRIKDRRLVLWLGAWVERRFCLDCRWGGLVRRARGVPAPLADSIPAR